MADPDVPDDRTAHFTQSFGLSAASFVVLAGGLAALSQMAAALNMLGQIAAGICLVLGMFPLTASIYYGGRGIMAWSGKPDSAGRKDRGNFSKQAVSGVLGLIFTVLPVMCAVIWGVDRGPHDAQPAAGQAALLVALDRQTQFLVESRPLVEDLTRQVHFLSEQNLKLMEEVISIRLILERSTSQPVCCSPPRSPAPPVQPRKKSCKSNRT